MLLMPCFAAAKNADGALTGYHAHGGEHAAVLIDGQRGRRSHGADDFLTLKIHEAYAELRASRGHQ